MTKPNKVTVTMKAIEARPLLDLFEGRLDSFERIVKTSEGSDRVVVCLYELGALRFDIAMNAKALKVIVDNLATINDACIKAVTNGGNSIDPVKQPEFAKAYMVEMLPVQQAETSIDLVPLSRAALKLDVNQIPIGALMLLEAHGLLAD